MSNLLQGRNIYLIGMMGSGKTTIGNHLAQSLNYRFIDTDQTIEEREDKSVDEIFDESGEAAFRKLETEVLEDLSKCTRAVIATGGGIIEQQRNRDYLQKRLTVWLDVDLEILKKRVAQDATRPLAVNLESLLKTRRRLYAKAKIQIKVSGKPEPSPEELAAQIIATLEQDDQD